LRSRLWARRSRLKIVLACVSVSVEIGKEGREGGTRRI
jgi:hypothetical protein